MSCGIVSVGVEARRSIDGVAARQSASEGVAGSWSGRRGRSSRDGGALIFGFRERDGLRNAAHQTPASQRGRKKQQISPHSSLFDIVVLVFIFFKGTAINQALVSGD